MGSCSACGANEEGHLEPTEGPWKDKRYRCPSTGKLAKMSEEEATTNKVQTGLNMSPSTACKDLNIASEVEKVLGAKDLLEDLRNQVKALNEGQAALQQNLSNQHVKMSAGLSETALEAADRLAEAIKAALKEKREPKDAAKIEDLENLRNELEPLKGLHQNLVESLGQSSCDNCGEAVDIDRRRCPSCDAKLYWEF